jgi:hypothetical protein
MTDWTARIETHQATHELMHLSVAFQQCEELAKTDGEATTLLGRMKALHSYIADRLKHVDPVLASESLLVSIATGLQNWRSSILNYPGNGNVVYLSNGMAQADAVMQSVALLPNGKDSQRPEHIKQYHSAVESFIGEISNRQRVVSTAIGALEKRIEQAEAQLTQVNTQVQNVTSAQQLQFSQAQEQRLNDFGRTQSEHANEFSEFLQDMRDTAELTNNEVKANLDELRRDTEEELDILVKRGRDSVANLSEELKKAAEAILLHLEKQRGQADKLVGLIGERGVTSSYQKVANQARIEMWLWHVITLIALGALTGAAIFEFLPAMRNGWNWGAFAGRLFISIACTLLAAYAGTQARASQQVMRENRQREMDLAAIGPYLAPLPEEMQREFRLKLADRTFAPSAHSVRPEDGNGAAILSDPDVRKVLTELTRTGVLETLKSLKT